MNTSLEIGRALFRSIPLYVPDTLPDVKMDVSDNTNLFGVPPSATRALQTMPASVVTRYPIPYGVELKAELARHLRVPVECIATGCGSDDVLDCALRAFGDPGDVVAHALPTFGMIPIFAQLNGLKPIGVPLKSDWDVDVEGLLKTQSRILYLCSPNNPTGTMVSRGAMKRLLRESRGVILLDEAYADFCGVSDLDAAPTHGRLLVTRTFSKAFGLAGLRIGYGIGSPELIREVEKSRGPYTLSAVAEQTALAVLRNDLGWIEARAREAGEVRERLSSSLKAMGYTPVPGAANFVLVAVPGARDVAQRMLSQDGIVVRAFSALPGVGDALRIGVGPWPMMEQFLEALRKARS
jgi:histidinol-phosphate aminotransferase